MNSLGSFPSGTGAGQAGAPPYIVANQWYCAVYTWSGDSIKMYINGVLKFKYAYSQSNGISADDLFIGKRNDVLYPYYFQGKLDEIRIYNRALNAKEVNAYCAGCNAIQTTPNFISSADTFVCPTKSLLLKTVNTLPASYAYEWSPSATLNSSSAANVTASPIANTIYHLLITDTNGCTNTDSVSVGIHPTATVNAGGDFNLCTGNSAPINATGIGTFVWTPFAGLSNVIIPNPNCATTITRTYTVTITNAQGCTATDDIVVTVTPPPTFVLPNQTSYWELAILHGYLQVV
jgi:hypothetical protein